MLAENKKRRKIRKLSSFLLVDGSQACESPERTAALTQQTQIKTEHDPGTSPSELTFVYQLVYMSY